MSPAFRVSTSPNPSRRRWPSALSRWRSTAYWSSISPIRLPAIPESNSSRARIRALELIRHDAAHVLAEAVQALFPGTQGDDRAGDRNGFYYDFYRAEPFTPEDFAAIERRCARSSRATAPSPRKCGRATRRFPRKGRKAFKVELVQAIPPIRDLKIYKQGDWLDLCRGPHMTSTGKIGEAFKIMKVAGAYWRGDSNPDAHRIYGGLCERGRTRRLSEATRRSRASRSSPARGARWTCSISGGSAGAIFWHPKGWTLFQTLIAHMRRAAGDYQEVNARR